MYSYVSSEVTRVYFMLQALVEKVSKEGGYLGYLKQVSKDIKQTDRHVELDEEKGRGLVCINTE